VSGTVARASVRRTVLDAFTLDYGLCMYCGVCVEAGPFDALHWAADRTPAQVRADELGHGTDRLAGWTPADRSPTGTGAADAPLSP
jgi:formate hydrogenlyase subunit 6/NADH:ubiquinone oxidoreductase subunit I